VIDQHGAERISLLRNVYDHSSKRNRGVPAASRRRALSARVWRLLMTENQAGNWEIIEKKSRPSNATKSQQKLLHAHDQESDGGYRIVTFNTAIRR